MNGPFDYTKLASIKDTKMCVYKITNTVNGKVYIGKTQSALILRIRRHCAEVRKGTNRYLYDAIRCYGWDLFSIEVLEECTTAAILNEREIFWIATLKSSNKEFGYNLTKGGDGGGFPPELIKKFADMRRGVPLSDEVKRKISEGNKGKKTVIAVETRKKISASLKGRMPSKPIHELMKGKPGARLGAFHTKETKKLMSIAKIGKPIFSEEQKKEKSENWMGFGNPTYIHISKEDLISSIIEGLDLYHLSNRFNVSPQTIWSKIKLLLGFDGLVQARNNFLGENKKVNSSLTTDQVKIIKQRLFNGEKQKDLAIEFCVSKGAISHIARGTTWKDI